MPARAHPGLPEIEADVRAELVSVAALPQVRKACNWLIEHEYRLRSWQVELAKIPAPPFGESSRSEWLARRFLELGLEDVHIDEVGNVLGVRRGRQTNCVSVSAHIDTVFPAGTELDISEQGSRLFGPGISDNAAGVTALLGIVAALQSEGVTLDSALLFIGNVGEEGEGDLRGIRHIFFESAYRDLITYSVVLDGAGSETIVCEALGSRRFEVTLRGAGGHSWTDFGVLNPIQVLSHAIHLFAQTSLPSLPKTTFNIGIIRGGTSVNSIPESACMRVDIRSASVSEIDRLEKALRDSVSSAIEVGSRTTANSGPPKPPQNLTSEVVCIGDRPGGELNHNAHILQVIRAVDFELGNIATQQRASTDANIPISLGREAIAIGGGGSGGGAHTQQEWFDCEGRALGLKRALLSLLLLAGMEN